MAAETSPGIHIAISKKALIPVSSLARDSLKRLRGCRYRADDAGDGSSTQAAMALTKAHLQSGCGGESR
jgi:hypothetical protein